MSEFRLVLNRNCTVELLMYREGGGFINLGRVVRRCGECGRELSKYGVSVYCAPCSVKVSKRQRKRKELDCRYCERRIECAIKDYVFCPKEAANR